MADLRKGTSSSVDSKEKKASLDDEIGKEFLGSWKSLSMAGDDAMDFNFDTVSSGSKKTFNFDKLVNLDGDFDKLTSFKVDMPDLDFSSSSKKITEPKGNSKGDSSGNKQRKRDCFNFSFDFNELDSFNFGSTLIKGEKVSTKKLDGKDAGADRNGFDIGSTLTEGERVSGKNIVNKDADADKSEHQGIKVNLDSGDAALDDCQTEGEKISVKNLDNKDAGSYRNEHQGSKVNLVGGNKASVDCPRNKLPASNSANTVVETTVDGAGTGNSSNDKRPSTYENIEEPESSYAPQTSPEKALSLSGEETDQQIHIMEKTKFIEPFAQDTTHILAVQSVDQNDFQTAESDNQASSPASKVNRESGGKQNVADRKIAVVGSNHSKLQLTIPDPPQSNGSMNNRINCEKADSETPTGNLIGTGEMLHHLDVEATSNTNLLQTGKHDFEANKNIKKSTSEVLIPLRSESAVKKVPIKEKEPEVVSSQSILRSKETVSQLCPPSSISVQVSSSVSKGIATLSAANEKRVGISVNGAETQRKSIGGLKSLSMELTKGEPDSRGNEKNAKNLCNIWEGFNGNGTQNICKPITIPRRPDKEVIQEDSTALASGMNDMSKSGGNVNPVSSTDKATKSDTQTSVNSRAVVSSLGSTWNLKMASFQELKTGKRMPNVSSLKISRTMEVSKDQSNAALEREIISSRKLEKDKEVRGSTESKIVHPIVNAEGKTLPITSLKRKTSEASIAGLVHLHPQKRLSESPRESRNLEEPLESTVEVQCCNHDNQPVSTKAILYNHPASGLEIPNTKEHDISLTMENDGNVEKAEAYAKDLEDICNMLKKKHEEAKELLVRAVVNNNSLLMLNHPMFDAKIQKVQKFAAQLISN